MTSARLSAAIAVVGSVLLHPALAPAVRAGQQEGQPPRPTQGQNRIEVFGGVGRSDLYRESLYFGIGRGTSVDVGARWRRGRLGAGVRLTSFGHHETWTSSSYLSIKDYRNGRWVAADSVGGRMTMLLAEVSVHSLHRRVAPYAVGGIGVAWLDHAFQLQRGDSLPFSDTLRAGSIGAGLSLGLVPGRLSLVPELKMFVTASGDSRMSEPYLGVQALVGMSYRF